MGKTCSMDLEDGKLLLLQAFCQLAWAEGEINQAQSDFISDLAQQMDLPLGRWVPALVTALSRPPRHRVSNLADVPIDEVERFQVVERFVALCLVGGQLSSKQAQTLADLSLQLGLRAAELEEIRRRLC